MLNLLSKIPAQSRRTVARGLLPVAGVAAAFGLLFVGLGIAGGESIEECSGHLWWKECEEVYNDWSTSTSVFLIAAGSVALAIAVGSLIAAWHLATMQARFQRYAAILTGVESIGVQRIAHITRATPSRVRHEIQAMIDSEMISGFYVDYGADEVVSRKYLPKESHKTVVKCAECGTNNELIVGITRRCQSCGQPLQLPRV